MTFTVSDTCETVSTTATFTVTPPPDLTVNAPAPETFDACLDNDLQTAFDNWLAQFTYAGGCDPDTLFQGTTPPDLCDGGTATVTFTVSDTCETVSTTATFTVTPPPDLTVNAPAPEHSMHAWTMTCRPLSTTGSRNLHMPVAATRILYSREPHRLTSVTGGDCYRDIHRFRYLRNRFHYGYIHRHSAA